MRFKKEEHGLQSGWVSFFFFWTRNHSLKFLRNMPGLGQHICLSQPASRLAGRMPVCAHHNRMMLQPVPNIMTTSCCISHLLFFLMVLLPLSQGSASSPASLLVHLSSSLLHAVRRSQALSEFSVISRGLCATSASLFLSVSLACCCVTAPPGHITKLHHDTSVSLKKKKQPCLSSICTPCQDNSSFKAKVTGTSCALKTLSWHVAFRKQFFGCNVH